MNFHRPNRNPRRTAVRVLLSIAVVGGLLFGANTLFDGQLSTLARLPASSLSNVDSAFTAAVGSAHGVLVRNDAVLAERDELKERVQELEVYALNNLVLKAENEELRKLLGDTPESHTGIATRVLTRGGATPYGVLTIAQPQSASIVPGALVYGAYSIGLGVVTDVSHDSAQVALYSQPQRQTDVLIESGEVTTPAVVTGLGNGNFIARVARDADIAVGDAVVLASRTSVIIGVVGDIATTPTDAFKTVRMRTPLNISTLHFVSVE